LFLLLVQSDGERRSHRRQPGTGGKREDKWTFLLGGLGRFAGRELTLSNEVYASAAGTNHRNRAIANLLASRGRIYWDPAETVDLYTRQSCLLTSADDLAVMTATLDQNTGHESSQRAPIAVESSPATSPRR